MLRLALSGGDIPLEARIVGVAWLTPGLTLPDAGPYAGPYPV